MSVRIETSGWVYAHWRGVFYPEELRPGDWFAYYAHEFDTVEINNSFYRLPSENAFAAWRQTAPPGFVYSVKASRYLTHVRRLNDPEEPLKRFFERAKLLGPTLGPVLYQLPPRWHANQERFEEFLGMLPQGYTNVVEFRDPTWLIEDIFQLMTKHHVAHCLHDFHTLDLPLRVTAPPVYIRFHGDVHHEGNYSREALSTWAGRINGWRRDGLDVFAYFNNDIGGYAIENARTLKALLGPAFLSSPVV